MAAHAQMNFLLSGGNMRRDHDCNSMNNLAS